MTRRNYADNLHLLDIVGQDLFGIPLIVMTSGERFERLLAIMARLRGPGGCPWDREQTLDSLRPYLIEETYEVLDALERRAWDELAEELGDLQLQIVFQARIAADEGLFTIDDPLDRIAEKLIRRHPHVFADGDAQTSGEVVQRWEEIKAAEKAAKTTAGTEQREESLLDEVSRSQPALLEAREIGKKASKVGFDWGDFEPLLDKLREETNEIADARQTGDPDRIEDEVGDLLFVAVNIARFLQVDPELALRRTNRKIRRRFQHIERRLREQGRSVNDASLDEMEELWQEAKAG